MNDKERRNLRALGTSVASNHTHNGQKKRLVYLFLPIVVLIALTMYFLTAPRTITWWFGSSYKLAAATFGIHYPPGSLLLTILGWPITQLPLGISKAFSLNLLASALAALTLFMMMWSVLDLTRQSRTPQPAHSDDYSDLITSTAIGSGGLTLAFSVTFWRYAVELMPYVLTAVFTAFILCAILKWWKQDGTGGSDRVLFLIMLLFGLDFSVHRTNLLLMPGFLVWVLVYRPRVFGRIESWAAGGVGLLVGLAVQLLTIPLAGRDPFLNAGDPSNWGRFYYYVSLQQYGGGWLVNMWPRQAPFWDVQLKDYVKVFVDNFVSYGGVLALAPLIFALVGTAALWRQDRRLTVGVLLLFLCSSLGAIFYFNLPEGFLQPMDRHYIPSFVIFALFVAYGTAAAALYASRILRGKFRIIAVSMVLLCALAIPVKELLRNYRSMDRRHDYFAHDYASNILGTLQPNSLLIVAGDSYNVVSYLQAVENVRPDVVTLSLSLLNAEWYVRQVTSQHPDLPLNLSEEELAGLGPKQWSTKTIATRVDSAPRAFQLSEGSSLPDTLYLDVPPTAADLYLLAQDWLIARMIEGNQWRRPIYFTSPPDWLARHTRTEGLVSRLIPLSPAVLNGEILRENLFDRYRYRGFSDPSVPIDRTTKAVGYALEGAFCALARYEHERGDGAACLEVVRKLGALIPIERVDPPPPLREEIEKLCKPE